MATASSLRSPSFAVAFSNQVAALCARKSEPGYSGSSPIAVNGMLLDALVSLAMSVGRCRLRLLYRCYHSELVLIARSGSSGWNGPSPRNSYTQFDPKHTSTKHTTDNTLTVHTSQQPTLGTVHDRNHHLCFSAPCCRTNRKSASQKMGLHSCCASAQATLQL